jgi:hypothetical protein
MNPRKKAWISLDYFGRFGASQWVTTNPNKKILIAFNSRFGLCSRAYKTYFSCEFSLYSSPRRNPSRNGRLFPTLRQDSIIFGFLKGVASKKLLAEEERTLGRLVIARSEATRRSRSRRAPCFPGLLRCARNDAHHSPQSHSTLVTSGRGLGRFDRIKTTPIVLGEASHALARVRLLPPVLHAFAHALQLIAERGQSTGAV